MEKTSIAIAFKGGKMTILATGNVDEVLAAYREAEQDSSNEFVGMLRKPVWYKRNTPARNKVRHEQSLRSAEGAEVLESRSTSQKVAAQAESDIAAELAAKEDEARLKAEREKAQGNLNANLASMEESERNQRAAAAEEEARLAEESVTEVSPSTEMEKHASKKSGKKG